MLIQAIGSTATEIPDTLVHEAARCWRSARGQGRPVLPCLHALLAPRGLEMLTLVLAGLMEASERFLDRDLCVGCPLTPSSDETLICRLIADPSAMARIAGARRCGRSGADLASVMVCALRSTRVMMEMAAPEA
jgi:hypothetical protein